LTVVALVLLPVVLVYQGWAYYVFRRRLGLAAEPDGEARVDAVDPA
jgi:cytochrome bd ubiquinol oxidase subunit II